MSAELIMAGAALGGGLINSAGQLFANKQQQDFTERMSNTAHQREVKDLLAAGLNPILSATGGKGASTPSITPGNPTAGLATSLNDAARTVAVDVQRIKNEKVLVDANSAKAAAETRNIDADTVTKLQTADRNDQVVRKLLADIANVEQATRTSSAAEAESRTRTGKTEQEAALLKAVVPFITNGTNAIRELVDYLSAGGKMGDAAFEMVQKISHTIKEDIPNTARRIVDTIKKYAADLIPGPVGGVKPNYKDDPVLKLLE